MNRQIIAILLLTCGLIVPIFAQDIAPREDKSKSLKIMCYNVHNLVGMDGKRDGNRIAGVINY